MHFTEDIGYAMNKIKKILKFKILPNWVLLVFVIILSTLWTFGWKITYNPQLDNNWNAIDAVGGWISAIISGIAIWFAVYAPKHIAQEQNKIALFEKRFASYSVFLKYTSFAETIRQIDTLTQLRQAFLLNFMEYGDVTDPKELLLIIKNDEKQLMSGLFLFSNFCSGEKIRKILQGILEVASLMQNEEIKLSEKDKDKIYLFCNECKSFTTDYMDEMRKQLTIRDF